MADAELETLREKAAGLQAELGACRRRLEREKKLRLRAQARAAEWRRRVEELNKEIEDMKGREKATSSIEVQTEESSVWSYADYHFYHNYYSNSDPDNLPSVPIETDNEISKSTCTKELQLSDHPNGNDVKDDEQGEHNNVIHTVQKSEDNLLTESSLVESLRAAAEAAVSQTGFVYDENTGLYYDHNTGFYYDSENQLYYDPATGIYYYCDIESGRYHFHSRVDLQSYGSANTQNSKDKKGKKKRKDTEWPAANEHKEDDQKSPNSLNCLSAINKLNHPEEDSASTKRMKVDTDRKNSVLSKEPNTLNDTSLHLRNTPCTAAVTDDSKSESESEPEEGEITNSEEEESTSDEEVRSEGTVNSEDTDSEDGDKIWPPCIRVIVIRSPVLQMGSLYIITAVKPATIGREKAMEHTLHIPELGVSKFHAEVYFDHELQSYVLVDQGSQNGTVVNGNQILQPKTKSEPHILEHGDEVKIGETVLSFHIHPGSETCDGCEPGQVRAHLRLDKKNKCSAGPVLTKEEKELIRRKAMKQIRVKYGLQNTEYENEKILKNPNYKDRAEKRRETVGSEGSFHRDDAPASVDVEISHKNRGHKLLEKMGWKKGEGLGKCGAGRKDPIKLQMHRKHAGLGSGTPVSIEDIQIINTNKRNWEKARERFAENFQDSKSQKNIPKDPTWIRETAE